MFVSHATIAQHDESPQRNSFERLGLTIGCCYEGAFASKFHLQLIFDLSSHKGQSMVCVLRVITTTTTTVNNSAGSMFF